RPGGGLVLLDFGLTRSAGASSLTESGAVVGSPGFLAPEQVQGLREITPACDVHGLGALLYALLTGTAPFTGPTLLAGLAEVLERVPTWPVGTPPDLEAVGRRALAKDPAARYSSATELGEALHHPTRR